MRFDDYINDDMDLQSEKHLNDSDPIDKDENDQFQYLNSNNKINNNVKSFAFVHDIDDEELLEMESYLRLIKVLIEEKGSINTRSKNDKEL